MSSKVGGIIGAVVGLVLTGGLVSTPFYLSAIASPQRRLETAARADVETLERLVANLDWNLAVASYIYQSIGDEAAFEGDTAVPLARKYPDLLGAELIARLDASKNALERIEKADDDRGTRIIGKGAIESRVRHTIERFGYAAKPVYERHEQRLRDAEATLNRMRTLAVGDLRADGLLSVNRVRTAYQFAKGRLYANRARFEYQRADLARAAAEAMNVRLRDLQQALAASKIERPDEAIARLEAEKAAWTSAASLAAGRKAQLEKVLQEQEAALQEARAAQQEAREELNALQPERLSFEEYRRSYVAVSDRLRSAEADAAAIENGTLRNANPVTNDVGEVVAYEGGQPEPGIDAIRFRLEQVSAQQSAVEEKIASLDRQLESLKERASDVQSYQDEIKRQIAAIEGNLASLIERMGSSLDKARKAEEPALAALRDAARDAKATVTAARNRTREASRASAAGGGEPDERLQRVAQDLEPEISAHCAVAEIAYVTASVLQRRIEAVRSAEALGVGAGDESAQVASAPAAADLESWTTEAVNQLAAANEAFGQAETLLGRATLRTTGGSASGKNYVWQVQVGKAAVDLLHSALLSDDADVAFAMKARAYDLLKQIAQGREQSPLLTPALDAIEYLQLSVQ